MEENIETNKKNNAESKLDDTEVLDSQNSEKIESNQIIKSANGNQSDKTKEVSKNIPNESSSLKIPETKPKKELPIEKKPFEEFINMHLIPALVDEFTNRGLEIEDINLTKTLRPIAGDECWVIYCQIKEICKFWLSFEKDDISSTKSISLSKSDQKPSIIESFLIDEKRITLKLIISRILQRLNGQKLIGVN